MAATEYLVPTRLGERAPLPLSQDDRSRWQQYFLAHQTVLDTFDRDIQDVIAAHQLPHASGIDLELIGRGISETLGKRRGRGDDVYRHFLRSLNSAFGGRGRKADIEYALSTGVLAEREDIILTEDVSTLSYEVELQGWQGHPLSLIDTLCDYADAPVVQRTGPIRYGGGETATVSVGASESARGGIRASSGTSAVTVAGTESGTRINWSDGFGGFEFDDGHRFDVEEPSDIPYSSITAAETVHVESDESEEFESPFEHDGVLNQDGIIDHDD